MTNHNNPWAGLASYEDPAKSERKLKFCGRDNDIYDVTRLIDDNLLVILYGKSGIGKTSLLNAGVFPKLRLEQYLPVSIRLGTLEADSSYQEAIVSAIENAIKEVQGSITVFNVVEEQTDRQQPDCLWNYFARHRFANAEGQPLFPVVVLDQFEEVLRNASPEHVDKARKLLNQLQYLIDESHVLNDCVVDGQEYFYDFNFRFVISIREDELYLLEDNIDDLSLSMFRNCRYRLRSLSEQEATEAILSPGKDCIAEEQKQAVVDRIVALSKRMQSNDIDTLLLSLVCSGSFDKKAGEKITVADLALWKDNPMEVYYQDAVKGLTTTQVRYIQRHFIREDGSRRRVNAEEVKVAFGETTYRQLIHGANRLLTLGDKGQVELLHDQLGMAVYEDRKVFEERERKKKLRQRVIAIGLVMLAIAGIFIFQNHKLKQQRAELKENQQRMIMNQSRFIAEKAVSIVNDGDSYTAQRILLEILPEDLEHPNRPYTPEGDRALHYLHQHKNVIIRNAFSYSARYSPDGRTIVWASRNSIIIWDVDSGKEIKSKAENGRCSSASYSPDGRNVVYILDMSVPTMDNTIGHYTYLDNYIVKILDLQTDTERELTSLSTRINSVNYSPDGKQIITASHNGIVNIFDTETGEELWELKHPALVTSANYSPDGKFIVSASYNTIRIWSAETGTEIRKLGGHTRTVESASFSPDGKWIVSASDKTIRIWETETGKEIKRIEGHTDDIQSACYSPDGRYIASASRDKTIRIWDAESGIALRELKGHIEYVYSVNYSPDGNYIVSTSWDNTIRIWRATTDEEIMKLAGTTGGYGFNSTNYSPNGQHIVAASGDGRIRVWDALSGEKQLEMGTYNYAYTASYSSDNKYIVSTAMDGTVRIWDAATGVLIRRIKHPCNYVYSANYSPDGKQIVSASGDYIIRVWDADTNTEPKMLEGHTGEVHSVSYSPDGNYILSAAYDSTIRVWDAKTGENLTELSGHTDWVHYASYSPDGKQIVSASKDMTVRIWDASTGIELKELIGHTDGVNSANYSPDGKYIVSASNDNTIRIWDAASGLEVMKLDGHTDRVKSASFSPDNRVIISASWDGTVQIWPFPPLQELIDQTRERFKDRPLTDEERRMYYLE